MGLDECRVLDHIFSLGKVGGVKKLCCICIQKVWGTKKKGKEQVWDSGKLEERSGKLFV